METRSRLRRWPPFLKFTIAFDCLSDAGCSAESQRPGRKGTFVMDADDTSNSPAEPSFPERVWEIVVAIPPGQVTTYGTIAAVLGNRRAARMVGWALSSCPEHVGEHAHRVVNRYGELSGGWSWGHPDIMRALLEDEGVQFVADYQVDLDRHLWVPPLQDNPEDSE